MAGSLSHVPVGERGTIRRGRQASEPKLEHSRSLPPEWDPALFAPLAEDTNALTAIEVNVGNFQGGQLGDAGARIVEGREEDMIPLAAPSLAKQCAKGAGRDGVIIYRRAGDDRALGAASTCVLDPHHRPSRPRTHCARSGERTRT